MKRKYKILSIVGAVILVLGLGIFFLRERYERKHAYSRDRIDWGMDHVNYSSHKGDRKWRHGRHERHGRHGRYKKQRSFENREEYESFLEFSSKEYNSFDSLLEGTKRVLNEQGYEFKSEVVNYDPKWAVLRAQKEGQFFSAELESLGESKSKVWVVFSESQSFRRRGLNKDQSLYEDFFSQLDSAIDQ